MSLWPISLEDVRAAEQRIRPFLNPSPAYSYPMLDAAVGHGVRVVVKHENFNPTGSFKVRNGLSFMTALPTDARARGVAAATRGNHGLGLAYAGRAFGTPVTVCVPVGNNPDKNAGMRALGARVIEDGRDYDESALVADRIVRETGATLAHSTNDRAIVAGAGTITLELLEQAGDIDSVVVAVGGGSQAVGALTVLRALKPTVRVYAGQAAGAAAAHDSWHRREPLRHERCDTFADGLATRSTYELTFPTLLEGLAGFVTVTEQELADAVRLAMSTTHTLVEGAGACGLAALCKLAPELAGQRVAIVFSGGNIDEATLRRVLLREL